MNEALTPLFLRNEKRSGRVRNLTKDEFNIARLSPDEAAVEVSTDRDGVVRVDVDGVLASDVLDCVVALVVVVVVDVLLELEVSGEIVTLTLALAASS